MMSRIELHFNQHSRPSNQIHKKKLSRLCKLHTTFLCRKTCLVLTGVSSLFLIRSLTRVSFADDKFDFLETKSAKYSRLIRAYVLCVSSLRQSFFSPRAALAQFEQAVVEFTASVNQAFQVYYNKMAVMTSDAIQKCNELCDVAMAKLSAVTIDARRALRFALNKYDELYTIVLQKCTALCDAVLSKIDVSIPCLKRGNTLCEVIPT